MAIIPQPKSVDIRKGKYSRCDDVRIDFSFSKRGVDGYVLEVEPDWITVRACSPSGVFYASQTLRQLAESSANGSIPCCRIEDWPDFEVRGVYYDISRGRIPRISRLKEQIDLLSQFKINHFQLYFEHVFKFKKYPQIWKNSGGLSPDDIRGLDKFCQDRFVELVPSLASFGHMANILKHDRFKPLAEDYGEMRYKSPDFAKLPEWQKRKGWSLSPANPGTYKLLDELFREFLPCFSSGKFNVCCDETFDMGMGQSYALSLKKGSGRLYLDHILRLRDIAGKYGKRIMLWGDMLHKYPELISRMPGDVTVLDWGYDHDYDFRRVARLKNAGLDFYACPGTSSWVSLFPRMHEAEANISSFARIARKNGAKGMMVADWGDGGHYNFMEYSWPGYVFGAEQAWNAAADKSVYNARFVRQVIKTSNGRFANALSELGDIAHTSAGGLYQSVWAHIFFACPGDKVLNHDTRDSWVCRKGRISRKRIRFDAKYADVTVKRLLRIRDVFESVGREPGTDPMGLIPYWLFAVDTLIHAAKKLSAGAEPDRTARGRLAREIIGLRKRFVSLWMKRNQKTEICIALGRYDIYISCLTK